MTESVWNILNDLEDLLQTGYRVQHVAPQVNSHTTATVVQQNSLPSEGEVDSEYSNDSDTRKQIAAEILDCTSCSLHADRIQAVPGVGSSQPLVMVIGEAPGADEDRMGLPFVGPSGQYLDKWLKAVELSRHRNVYITNVVKCRPPGNRNPGGEEVAACIPYLFRQITQLNPVMILLLGRVAAQTALGVDAALSALRGRLHTVRGIPAIVTYHPSAVLRNQNLRGDVWGDMQLLRDQLMQLRSDYRPVIR